MKYQKYFYSIILALFYIFIHQSIIAHDFLLEVKGACFVPSDPLFKDVYGNENGLYGAEFTFRAYNKWYGFISADFFSQTGACDLFQNPSKIELIPLAIGAKYFISFCIFDFYLGLGFQPTYVKNIYNKDQNTPLCQANWEYGGIAKIGSYIKLPCNFFLDLFFDYSFIYSKCNASLSNEDLLTNSTECITPAKTNLSGTIFGAGLGYRF